jgi:hypothetical protein
MPQKPTMTITNMPTDVLSCIIQHLQQDVGQRDQTLDDIAALRSVCRSLRLASDLFVTHANFHANIDVAELRSTTRRLPGDQQGTSLLQACGWLVPHLACAGCRQRACILHRTPLAFPSHLPLCNILAGLQTVVLQQLEPDAAPSTLEALATLKHVRNLDAP